MRNQAADSSEVLVARDLIFEGKKSWFLAGEL